MEKPIIIYCFDAWCSWCYGFSPVMKRIAETYKDKFDIELISGGLIRPPKSTHIEVFAEEMKATALKAAETTGIKFGKDYMWHLENPDLTDWYPSSVKSAIAFFILKEIYPERQVEIATDLQEALFLDGRDLTDDEAYLHLLEKYSIQPELFFERLKSDEYKEQAEYEFDLCAKLKADEFPSLLVQESSSKFYLLMKGYTDYEEVSKRLDGVLEQIG